MSLRSVLNFQCPRCHEGKLFIGNAYQKTAFTMNKKCPHCNLKYEKEPSFFYGAMYISYSLNIALFVIFVVAYYLFFDEYIAGGLYISLYVVFTILLMSILYRLSRSLWINLFVDYEPEKRD